MATDYSVMTWLLNSVAEKLSAGVLFLKTAKETCDVLKKIYSNEKNISRIAYLSEWLLSLWQDDRPLVKYNSELKGILDELEFFQPPILDLEALQQYHGELGWLSSSLDLTNP